MEGPGCWTLVPTAIPRIGRERVSARGAGLLEQIDRENQGLAEAWRASDPKEKKLVIERTFKPPVLLAPTIRIKQTFKKDSRPWYRRVLG